MKSEAHHWTQGLPWWLSGKESSAMQEILGTRVQFLGWEDLWSRKWQLTPVFLPGKSHGQRSLATVHGGHKE